MLPAIRTRTFPFAPSRKGAVAEHRRMIGFIAAGSSTALADEISAHIAKPKLRYIEQLVASAT